MQYSLEESQYVQPTFNKWSLRFTSFKAEYLHKLFRIVLHRRFFYSLLFIYLLNRLFIAA